MNPLLRTTLGWIIISTQLALPAHAQKLGYSPNWRSEDPAYREKARSRYLDGSATSERWSAAFTLLPSLATLGAATYYFNFRNRRPSDDFKLIVTLGSTLATGTLFVYLNEPAARYWEASRDVRAEIAQDQYNPLPARILSQFEWELEKYKRRISAAVATQSASTPEARLERNELSHADRQALSLYGREEWIKQERGGPRGYDARMAELEQTQRQTQARAARVVDYLKSGATPDALRTRYPEIIGPQLYRLAQDYSQSVQQVSTANETREVSDAAAKTISQPTLTPALPRTTAVPGY